MTAWGTTLEEMKRKEKIMENCTADYYDSSVKEFEATQRKLMEINKEIRRVKIW
jgi:hypothetical protein